MITSINEFRNINEASISKLTKGDSIKTNSKFPFHDETKGLTGKVIKIGNAGVSVKFGKKTYEVHDGEFINQSNVSESHYADQGSNGDYEHNQEQIRIANKLYDEGQELFNQGNIEAAEEKRQQALKAGHCLDWTDTELPPYAELSNLNNENLISVLYKLNSVFESMLATDKSFQDKILLKNKIIKGFEGYKRKQLDDISDIEIVDDIISFNVAVSGVFMQGDDRSYVMSALDDVFPDYNINVTGTQNRSFDVLLSPETDDERIARQAKYKSKSK